MADTSDMVRTTRNDEDITRSIDIADLVSFYRKRLIANWVPDRLAIQMSFRLNERILQERVHISPPRVQGLEVKADG